jgi:hypothetical protein
LPEIREGTVFKINKFLSLKFEENQTRVYVNGEYFRQCIRLFLNIPFEQMEDYNEINSIDEAVDLDKQLSLWENQVLKGSPATRVQMEHSITPEEEFRGHCSNLQAWYENKYDTRILYHNLAFPLLKALADVGDPLAKKRFKDEIFQRFKSNYPSVILFLIEASFLKSFTKEELITLSELLTDPNLRIRTKHYSFIYCPDPAFYYSVEGRIEFVNDIIEEFKRQDNPLSIEFLINEHFIQYFYSDEINKLSKYVKSVLMRRLLPHFHKRHHIDFNKKRYDVVISEALWIKKLEKDPIDKNAYRTIYSLDERKNFRKIKINATVYYDFDIIEELTFPIGWIQRAYIQYKDFWNAYRFLNKNPDCKLYIPNPTHKDVEPFRMVSENEGYSITISAEIISLNELTEKRDRRRKRLYNRIERRRSEKFRELCIQIHKTQIDTDKCKPLNCLYAWGNKQCNCIYEGKSLSEISSGLAYSCKQKSIFEKNKVFEFYRNRIRTLWKLKKEKDCVERNG